MFQRIIVPYNFETTATESFLKSDCKPVAEVKPPEQFREIEQGFGCSLSHDFVSFWFFVKSFYMLAKM